VGLGFVGLEMQVLTSELQAGYGIPFPGFLSWAEVVSFLWLGFRRAGEAPPPAPAPQLLLGAMWTCTSRGTGSSLGHSRQESPPPREGLLSCSPQPLHLPPSRLPAGPTTGPTSNLPTTQPPNRQMRRYPIDDLEHLEEQKHKAAAEGGRGRPTSCLAACSARHTHVF
jgi:hypothetical protein